MLKLDASEFTTGRARFEDNAPWSSEWTPKIYVKITPENLGVVLFALLDTGSPWSLLDAEVADSLDLLNGDGEPKTVKTWRGDVHGRLERVTLILHADEGQSLDFEAT